MGGIRSYSMLFPEEDARGYGYVDLCKSPQKQIDLMNQAILKNTLAAATPRFFHPARTGR